MQPTTTLVESISQPKPKNSGDPSHRLIALLFFLGGYFPNYFYLFAIFLQNMPAPLALQATPVISGLTYSADFLYKRRKFTNSADKEKFINGLERSEFFSKNENGIPHLHSVSTALITIGVGLMASYYLKSLDGITFIMAQPIVTIILGVASKKLITSYLKNEANIKTDNSYRSHQINRGLIPYISGGTPVYIGLSFASYSGSKNGFSDLTYDLLRNVPANIVSLLYVIDANYKYKQFEKSDDKASFCEGNLSIKSFLANQNGIPFLYLGTTFLLFTSHVAITNYLQRGSLIQSFLTAIAGSALVIVKLAIDSVHYYNFSHFLSSKIEQEEKRTITDLETGEKFSERIVNADQENSMER